MDWQGDWFLFLALILAAFLGSLLAAGVMALLT